MNITEFKAILKCKIALTRRHASVFKEMMGYPVVQYVRGA